MLTVIEATAASPNKFQGYGYSKEGHIMLFRKNLLLRGTDYLILTLQGNLSIF